jgi:hypothetical protein
MVEPKRANGITPGGAWRAYGRAVRAQRGLIQAMKALEVSRAKALPVQHATPTGPTRHSTLPQS